MIQLFLLEQGYDPQKDNRTHHSGEDLSDDSAAEAYAQPVKKVSTDESTQDTYQQINKESKAEAFNEPSCKESCKCSD